MLSVYCSLQWTILEQKSQTKIKANNYQGDVAYKMHSRCFVIMGRHGYFALNLVVKLN
jgi:hypothetical protein